MLRPRLLRPVRWLLAGVVAAIIAALVVALGPLHLRLLDVQTNSMTPLFRAHDAVVVRPVNPVALRPGDIVSYRSALIAGQLVTHRVVTIDRLRQRLIVKGDRLPEADPPVPFTAVRGREVAVVPRIGTILEFVKKPLGLGLLIYLPAISIILSEFLRLQRHYQKQHYLLPGH